MTALQVAGVVLVMLGAALLTFSAVAFARGRRGDGRRRPRHRR